jgi:hypothetical protein
MLTERLSERLRELAASAAQLPPDVQDDLAERLAVELGNARWDAQVADEANLEPLREMIEEARRGPKLPWPSPEEAAVADHLEPEDLATLHEPEPE